MDQRRSGAGAAAIGAGAARLGRDAANAGAPLRARRQVLAGTRQADADPPLADLERAQLPALLASPPAARPLRAVAANLGSHDPRADPGATILAAGVAPVEAGITPWAFLRRLYEVPGVRRAFRRRRPAPVCALRRLGQDPDPLRPRSDGRGRRRVDAPAARPSSASPPTLPSATPSTRAAPARPHTCARRSSLRSATALAGTSPASTGSPGRTRSPPTRTASSASTAASSTRAARRSRPGAPSAASPRPRRPDRSASLDRSMRIAQSLIDEMVAHAREDLPNECCGMVGGRTIWRRASTGPRTNSPARCASASPPRTSSASPRRRCRSGGGAGRDLPLAHQDRRLPVADRRQRSREELAGRALDHRLAGRPRPAGRQGATGSKT